MTEAQERELVAVVERLTVEVQEIVARLGHEMGVASQRTALAKVGELNLRLCDAFPYLRDSRGDATAG